MPLSSDILDSWCGFKIPFPTHVSFFSFIIFSIDKHRRICFHLFRTNDRSASVFLSFIPLARSCSSQLFYIFVIFRSDKRAKSNSIIIVCVFESYWIIMKWCMLNVEGPEWEFAQLKNRIEFKMLNVDSSLFRLSLSLSNVIYLI